MDEMVHHCRAAATGTSRALLVGDLPFGSYLTAEDAARNGVRLVKEGRADAVKLEGGGRVVPQVRALVDAGVAVMGHIGLTPQSYAALGGYRVQGRTGAEAARLFEDALALQAAGCFAIVLEMVPAEVAQRITSLLAIPTIGIGAGGGTSGQVQVFHDLLGLYDQKVPKFVRQFSKLEQPMRDALAQYVHAVDARAFPQPRHTFPISHEHLGDFCRRVGLPPPQTPPPPPPVANNVVAEGLRDGAAPIVDAHAVSISTNGLTPTNTAAAASTPGRAAVALAGVGADGRTAPQVVGTIAESG
jgi:3-methyl-2-oxobutanoate hydroxymethyltransferase